MDYIVQRQPMFSRQGDAQSRVYRKVQGKKGVWLIAIQPNEGDNVYFHNPKDTKSEGFGGATLKFPLEDGTVYEAKGPWSTGSEACFADCGYDARDKHLTFVVLAKDVGYTEPYYNTIMKDVVYIDKEPTIGRFDRWKEIAVGYPEAVQVYAQSHGGSSRQTIRREELPKVGSVPTQKAEEIEEVLTALAGADRRDSIRAGRCLPPPIGCGGSAVKFKDALSRKEFAISGLCQKCQDSVFGE